MKIKITKVPNKFGFGGNIGADHTHGSIFKAPGDLVYIGEGGTHSENPYGGVQSGVDEEGTPNLVEEGEVIFNDYVFSNRLSPTKEQLKEALLPEKYADHTFAWIANELSKESEERANDAISMNGLNDSMNKLIQVHELVKQENKIQESNKFWGGGDLREKYNLNEALYERYKYDARQLLFKNGEEEDPNNHDWNQKLLNTIEELVINDIADEYAEKKSNATKGSPRYNEVYQQRYQELKSDQQKRITQENWNNQASQYRKDRGYPELSPNKQTGWSYGTYNQNRNLGMSDEDYENYVDIATGKKTYINGELGTPTDQSQEIYNGYQQQFDDDQILEDDKLKSDQLEYLQQYLSQLMGGYGFGYGYRGFGYPQQRQQPQDISLIAPDANELERQNRIAAQKELDKIGLYGLDSIKTPDNLTTQATPLRDTEKERMDKEAHNYIINRMRDANIPGEKFDPTSLFKYAPILGNALSLIGNRKDYSDVNAFMDKTQNPRSVEFTPIGNYIRPEYISPWEMINPIERQASATRSAIMDNSSNNRAAANAALVGSDYNTLGLLGQAYLQGKQYNNQQRLQAANFNRGTDQYNSQGALQASIANMSLNDYYLNRALQEYNMRSNIDMNYNNARSANSTALTQNLFNLYRDQYVRNQVNSNRLFRYIDTGFGNSARK